MQRRTLLQGGGAALATLGARARAATAGRRPPNFVIVLCDDLGYGDVSVYEPGGIKTPAIERMGREASCSPTTMRRPTSAVHHGRGC